MFSMAWRFWGYIWNTDKKGALLSIGTAILVMVLLAAKIAAVLMVAPYLKEFTDMITAPLPLFDASQALIALIMLTGAMLAQYLSTLLSDLLRARIDSWLMYHIRSLSVRRQINAEPRVFKTEKKLGGLVSQGITLDREFLIDGLVFKVGENVLLIIVNIWIISSLAGLAGFLVALSLVMVIVVGGLLLRRKVGKMGARKHELEDQIREDADQIDRLGRGHRLMSHPDKTKAGGIYNEHNAQYQKIIRSYRALIQTMSGGATLLVALSVLTIFWLLLTVRMGWVGWFTLLTSVSAGTIAVLVNSLMVIGSSMAYLASQQEKLDKARAAIGRLLPLFSVPQRSSYPSKPDQPLTEIVASGTSYKLPGMPSFSHVIIDGTFRKGWIYILYGANGSGKRTIAELLSGWLAPSEGAIQGRFRGGEVVEMSRIDPEKIAIVPRKIVALPGETVVQFLMRDFNEDDISRLRLKAGLEPAFSDANGPDKTPQEQAALTLELLLQQLGLWEKELLQDKLEADFSTLSIGRKRALAIIRFAIHTLIHEGMEIGILDEPTSEVDGRWRRLIVNAVRWLCTKRDLLLFINTIDLVLTRDIGKTRASGEVCFVEGGQITERGAYQTLLRKRKALFNYVQFSK